MSTTYAKRVAELEAEGLCTSDAQAVADVECAYANKHGWTDVYPHEIVRRVSARTLEIRPMIATRDPKWEPEILLGGYSGHCVNQYGQQWTYASNPAAAVIRIRLSARPGRGWRDKHGNRYTLSPEPIMFYDYNF